MTNIYDFIFQIKPGSFSCTRCMKSFKTAAPLEKHEKTHTECVYTDQIVVSLVKSAIEICISNGIHDDITITALSSYKIDAKSITALKDYLNSLKSNNAEIIYNRLFNDVTKNSQKYFLLPERASNVLCLKFTEFVISSLNKKEIVEQINTKNLTEKEVEGLKYLGGYVIRKLFMKLKTTKNKQETDEQAMQILQAVKAEKKSNVSILR